MALMENFPQVAAFPGLNLGRRHSDSSPASAEMSLPPGICITHASAVNGEKQHLQKLVSDSLHLTLDKFGRSALVYAVLGNQADCVDLLLRAGLSPDQADHGGRSALHSAAHRGFYTCLKLLVQRSCRHGLQDQDGVSPCHLAAVRGGSRCVQLLVKHLSSEALEALDCNKRTPLHWAAAAGCADHVKTLLRAGAGLLIPDVEGKTPLHWAASSEGAQAPQAVKLLLEAEPTSANWQDHEGRTALHVAVADGQLKAVAALLANQRCNIHCLDHQFRSALHWAALLGNTQTVQLLVEKGARIGATDANGASPLHYAAQNDHKEIVAVLMKKKKAAEVTDLSGRSALAWAAGSGALGVIETMVAQGGVLHLCDRRGETALFTASTCGQTAAAERLLALGADPNAASRSGRTPLFAACANGHADVVKLLLSHQADVNAAEEEGRRPLHAAARFGQSYVVHILLDSGALVDPADRHGRTPLMHAAYAGYGDVLTLLAGYGADVGARDVDGRSVLHWAAGQGQLDSVKVLLEQGVYPNHVARLSYHMTPLDCAVVGGHHEVAGCLTEYGGISIATIEDIASTKIQATWRGHLIRRQVQLSRAALLPGRETTADRGRQLQPAAARGGRGATVADRRKPTAGKKPAERRQQSRPPADSAIEEIVCSFLEHVVGQAGPRRRQLAAADPASAASQYADRQLKAAPAAGARGRGVARRQGAAAGQRRKKTERRLEIPELGGASSDEEPAGPQEAAALTIQRAWRGHAAVRGKEPLPGSPRMSSPSFSYNMVKPTAPPVKRPQP